MTQKGKVILLNGTAVSKDAFGRDRILKEGDIVFSGDTITMGNLQGTQARIVMDNGREYDLAAGDVVRLRGEAPVDESFDVAGIIQKLLEEDAIRNEEAEESYNRQKFMQSNNYATNEINTDVDDLLTEATAAGGESGSQISESEFLTNGRESSVGDIVENLTTILDTFARPAGDIYHTRTSSFAADIHLNEPINNARQNQTIQTPILNPTIPQPKPIEPVKPVEPAFKVIKPLSITDKHANSISNGELSSRDAVFGVKVESNHKYTIVAKNAVSGKISVVGEEKFGDSQDKANIDTIFPRGKNKVLIVSTPIDENDVQYYMANIREPNEKEAQFYNSLFDDPKYSGSVIDININTPNVLQIDGLSVLDNHYESIIFDLPNLKEYTKFKKLEFNYNDPINGKSKLVLEVEDLKISDNKSIKIWTIDKENSSPHIDEKIESSLLASIISVSDDKKITDYSSILAGTEYDKMVSYLAPEKNYDNTLDDFAKQNDDTPEKNQDLEKDFDKINVYQSFEFIRDTLNTKVPGGNIVEVNAVYEDTINEDQTDTNYRITTRVLPDQPRILTINSDDNDKAAAKINKDGIDSYISNDETPQISIKGIPHDRVAIYLENVDIHGIDRKTLLGTVDLDEKGEAKISVDTKTPIPSDTASSIFAISVPFKYNEVEYISEKGIYIPKEGAELIHIDPVIEWDLMYQEIERMLVREPDVEYIESSIIPINIQIDTEVPQANPNFHLSKDGAFMLFDLPKLDSDHFKSVTLTLKENVKDEPTIIKFIPNSDNTGWEIQGGKVYGLKSFGGSLYGFKYSNIDSNNDITMVYEDVIGNKTPQEQSVFKPIHFETFSATGIKFVSDDESKIINGMTNDNTPTIRVFTNGKAGEIVIYQQYMNEQGVPSTHKVVTINPGDDFKKLGYVDIQLSEKGILRDGVNKFIALQASGNDEFDLKIAAQTLAKDDTSGQNITAIEFISQNPQAPEASIDDNTKEIHIDLPDNTKAISKVEISYKGSDDENHTIVARPNVNGEWVISSQQGDNLSESIKVDDSVIKIPYSLIAGNEKIVSTTTDIFGQKNTPSDSSTVIAPAPIKPSIIFHNDDDNVPNLGGKIEVSINTSGSTGTGTIVIYKQTQIGSQKLNQIDLSNIEPTDIKHIDGKEVKYYEKITIDGIYESDSSYKFVAFLSTGNDSKDQEIANRLFIGEATEAEKSKSSDVVDVVVPPEAEPIKVDHEIFANYEIANSDSAYERQKITISKTFDNETSIQDKSAKVILSDITDPNNIKSMGIDRTDIEGSVLVTPTVINNEIVETIQQDSDSKVIRLIVEDSGSDRANITYATTNPTIDNGHYGMKGYVYGFYQDAYYSSIKSQGSPNDSISAFDIADKSTYKSFAEDYIEKFSTFKSVGYNDARFSISTHTSNFLLQDKESKHELTWDFFKNNTKTKNIIDTVGSDYNETPLKNQVSLGEPEAFIMHTKGTVNFKPLDKDSIADAMYIHYLPNDRTKTIVTIDNKYKITIDFNGIGKSEDIRARNTGNGDINTSNDNEVIQLYQKAISENYRNPDGRTYDVERLKSAIIKEFKNYYTADNVRVENLQTKEVITMGKNNFVKDFDGLRIEYLKSASAARDGKYHNGARYQEFAYKITFGGKNVLTSGEHDIDIIRVMTKDAMNPGKGFNSEYDASIYFANSQENFFVDAPDGTKNIGRNFDLRSAMIGDGEDDSNLVDLSTVYNKEIKTDSNGINVAESIDIKDGEKINLIDSNGTKILYKTNDIHEKVVLSDDDGDHDRNIFGKGPDSNINHEEINAKGGDDFIDGNGSKNNIGDTINAGDGNDVIVYHANDRVDGGSGFDSLVITNETIQESKSINGNNKDTSVSIDLKNVSNIESIVLGDYVQKQSISQDISIKLSDILTIKGESKVFKIDTVGNGTETLKLVHDNEAETITKDTEGSTLDTKYDHYVINSGLDSETLLEVSKNIHLDLQ